MQNHPVRGAAAVALAAISSTIPSLAVPRNYHERFRGPLRAREALARSAAAVLETVGPGALLTVYGGIPR